MSIKPFQLRDLITLVLKDFDRAHNTSLWSADSVEQILFTAAHETLCGRWLWQNIDFPVALGLYQMEPIGYRQAAQYLTRHVPSYQIPPHRHVIWDHRAATILARAFYASWPEALPEASDVLGMAKYYKKYWNTAKGKATIDAAIEDYYRYAVERPI